MTDAKLYLMRIKIYDSIIDTKLEEVTKLRAMITKITPTLKDDAGSGSGGSQDKLGDAVAKIVDLEEEINHNINVYVEAKKKVSAILEQLTDAEQIQVLHKRYVQYKRWEQIACEMNMTYRNVCYIHGKALQVVNTIMKKDGAE